MGKISAATSCESEGFVNYDRDDSRLGRRSSVANTSLFWLRLSLFHNNAQMDELYFHGHFRIFAHGNFGKRYDHQYYDSSLYCDSLWLDQRCRIGHKCHLV